MNLWDCLTCRPVSLFELRHGGVNKFIELLLLYLIYSYFPPLFVHGVELSGPLATAAKGSIGSNVGLKYVLMEEDTHWPPSCMG